MAGRETHEALRRSEQFLERTGRVAGIGGWERDLLTNEISWSAETCRLLGVAPGYKPTVEQAGKFFAPEAKAAAAAAMRQAESGGEGWDLELPFVRADGHRVWLRSVGAVEFAAGRPFRLAGSLQDMTSQRAARLELKEMLERVTLATDAARVGIWDYDVATDHGIWNSWMYRLYGLEPRDGPATYAMWMGRVHPDDRAATEKAIAKGVESSSPFTIEYRIVWDDGSVHHIRHYAKETRDLTGRVVRIVGTNWDITESRELGAELVRRAELLVEAAEREMALFRNSPDSLTVIRVEEDASGTAFIYEAFSPAHGAVTGLKSEEMIGYRPEECLPAGTGEIVRSRYDQCLLEEKTITFSGTHTLPIGTRDFEGSITPVRNLATGKIVRLVGMMRDVTERNLMEGSLRQAQKMEAIGQLSAGVAHDFNNILQIIVGGLELVIDELDVETAAYEFANIALKSATQGASLTHCLLSYARKQILRPQIVEVAPLLDELKILLAHTLGPHIAISVGATRTGAVLADPGQLQTAMLNLAINASHAMPEGGLLRLDIRVEQEADKAWVVIMVTDNGSGMDSATLAHATEPFFSTKGLAGSGLGLSMVKGFAEQSDGRLHITSALGHGTTVELHLPSVTSSGREQAVLVKIPHGTRRILLVDDMPDLLATTAKFLEKSGFAVVRARGGDEALLLLRERFDAIVSDYAMPGQNGAELIAEIRKIQPGLKALLITGYVSDVHTATLPTDITILQKPFKGSELVEALCCILRVDRDMLQQTTDYESVRS
jgi:PAS domain S-box-containing protein